MALISTSKVKAALSPVGSVSADLEEPGEDREDSPVASKYIYVHSQRRGNSIYVELLSRDGASLALVCLSVLGWHGLLIRPTVYGFRWTELRHGAVKHWRDKMAVLDLLSPWLEEQLGSVFDASLAASYLRDLLTVITTIDYDQQRLAQEVFKVEKNGGGYFKDAVPDPWQQVESQYRWVHAFDTHDSRKCWKECISPLHYS